MTSIPLASGPEFAAVTAADRKHFRSVMGQWPTGVSVVAGIGAGSAPVGLVIGSFTSVSLEPALVAFCPMKSSRSWSQLRASERLTISILSDAQSPICDKLSGSEVARRFEDIEWDSTASGLPVIRDSAAWMEIAVQRELEEGDHFIVIGRVLHLDFAAERSPLVFSSGRMGYFVSHS